MRWKQPATALVLAAAIALAAAPTASGQTTETHLGGPLISNPPPSEAGIPRADVLEAMIKSVLASFNDANRTGNYNVLHAQLYSVFRGQTSASNLANTFAAFRTHRINLAPALVHRPHYAEEPRIEAEGRLTAKGYLETRPWRTNFDLQWIREDGEWRLWRLNVHVKPPD